MTPESERGRLVPPDLDDRTWQDLVDQMRALIPKYAPQWTDHNPSDLGITLIELFAWLGEGIIYRLNQTPEKNYLAFLNLLGITRDPPSPARTYLTFTGSTSGVVTVPAGTQAQTTDPAGGRPIVFETDEDLTVVPTSLVSALLAAGSATGTYQDVSADLVGPPAGGLRVDVPAGQGVSLLLGFDRATGEELGLDLLLYQNARTTGGKITCAFSHADDEPGRWPAGEVADGTEGLTHDGTLRLRPPAAWAQQRAGGPQTSRPWTTLTPAPGQTGSATPLFWVRLTVEAPDAVIGIDRLLFNAVSARTALSVRDPEVLGVSDGTGFQVFSLAGRPVYRRPGLGRPYRDLLVQVEGEAEDDWQDWELVEDLAAGPARAYRLDPVTGEIRFGNHDEQKQQGNGSVPAAGRRIRARHYRHVDSGAGGNVGPGQVVVLRDTPAKVLPAGIATVTNLAAARDGTDEEPIAETMRRAPEELRIRDRAVTVDDYEFLAREAAGDLRVVRCLGPRAHTVADAAPGTQPGTPWQFGGLNRAPGAVTVIIAPDRDLSVTRPEPTPDQIRVVQGYLDARRDLTAALSVTAPRYLPIIVKVEIQVWKQALDAGASLERVEAETRSRLQAFLHPTRGGREGTGWAVGEPVFTSDVFQALMPARDLGYISTLQVRPALPLYHEGPPDTLRRPFPLSDFAASVRLTDYELVCAALDSEQAVRVSPVPR
ncbi:putative baseplate assembly protein [Kineosporia babensis]|uniref:Baseplate assembly protein n=1 Tax=Kineosporia babensis TaxID=499548 RepID=A0A9X1NLJ3_9ACTN|nr:putative baseplate assembly protein [Kineosporia babensis]MCD5315946.1 putative baseplate assembly protein [Kineosporia babensis]